MEPIRELESSVIYRKEWSILPIKYFRLMDAASVGREVELTEIINYD